MTITTEQTNEKMTMHISGKLDIITAPDLEKAINELPEEITELVLDMSELGYISSAGLRVLLGAHKKFENKGSMKLIGVCDEVMEIFEMTGFANILVIE